MNIKALLCGAAMLSVCGVAQAFPNYTLIPADGSEFTSKQNFASFNLSLSGMNDIVISDTAYALLENADGDEIESTRFEDFMGSGTILINFDSDAVAVNGAWSFTIPAGVFTVNGEENPAITANYLLNDKTIGGGEYPQITLEWADPAEGSKLAAWDDQLNMVRLKTSDDDAVNYIEWTLWDVTNGEDEGVAEYIRQGNDNRFDLNRYGHSDDIWADGLYIKVSGNQKLILGHKYRVDLRFCGIGYDVATNQYPSPDELKISEELTTSIYYEGATPLQEYSYVKYESVSPDPENYAIVDPAFGVFTVTYTGPAKPMRFFYAVGMGSEAEAGTFEVAEGCEADEKGFATRWTFKFFEKVLAKNTGYILSSIESIGADGIEVRGNAGYDFDDTLYTMYWECNCGAAKLLSVDPANGAEVESLSSITLTSDVNLVMAYSFMAEEKARIVNMTGEEIRVLDEPVFAEDKLTATWEFEPITEEGTYILIVPSYYFNVGEEFNSTSTNETTFTYYVMSNEPKDIAVDWKYETVSPKNNEILSSINTVTFTFADGTLIPIYADGDAVNPLNVALIKLDGENEELLQEVSPVDNPMNDFWNPTIYDVNFEEVTEPGEYKVVVPEGTFCDFTFDENSHNSGHINPEFVIYYTIEMSGVESIVEGAQTINVYTLDGVQVLNNANVEAAKELPAGIYVINGKKVVVRK